MINKYNIYNYLFFFLLITLSLASCEKILNVPAMGSLSEEVLSNEEGVKRLLIGAYADLDASAFNKTYSEATPNNWIFGDAAGGILNTGGGGGGPAIQVPIANGHTQPNSSPVNQKWKADYDGISRANSVLNLLKRIENMSENEKDRTAAEARFLRGHYYFDLKKMFNMVPWIDENTEDKNQPNDVDIWPNIEEDFKYAMNNLPNSQSDAGRVNKWAAACYLAKTYVYQEKWELAKSLFDEIIKNGQTSRGIPYQLMDNFEDLYKASIESTNSEDVFSIQQVANDASGGGINNANQFSMAQFPSGGPFPCCGYNEPTQDFVNSFRTDDKGLPFLDNYNDVLVKNDLNTNVDEQFQPFQGFLDPRLDWSVVRRGIPFLDWGPAPGKAWSGNPERFGGYLSKKHVYWHKDADKYADNSSWGPGSAKNIYVIRYADVLLLAAETEIHLGNSDLALRYINLVRNRAGRSFVDNNLNIPYALAIVHDPMEVINLGINAKALDWVVDENDNSTYVFLGGNQSDINSWNKYTNTNYRISEYSSQEWNSIDQLKAIRFERKLELGLEGHRFFDLVRWGIAEQELNKFFKYTNDGAKQKPPITGNSRVDAIFVKGKNEYYPIPLRQIELSEVNGKPMLIQNPGYN